MQDPSESDELRFEQEQPLSLHLIRLTPGMTAHGVLTTASIAHRSAHLSHGWEASAVRASDARTCASRTIIW